MKLSSLRSFSSCFQWVSSKHDSLTINPPCPGIILQGSWVPAFLGSILPCTFQLWLIRGQAVESQQCEWVSLAVLLSMSRPSPKEHLLSAFGACWTQAIGWLSPDPGHGESRKECTYPPTLCPRVRETICQAPYGTVSPRGVEGPHTCAFLVKHRPGRAKNSLPWDQSRAGKWWERVSFLPGEPASVARPRQPGRVASRAGEGWLGS